MRQFAMLSSGQSERGGKRFWDAEQFDCHQARCRGVRIASEALLPVETGMRPLRTRKGSRRERWAGRTTGFHLHLYPLVTRASWMVVIGLLPFELSFL